MKRVVGVELSQEAVEDARVNALDNGEGQWWRGGQVALSPYRPLGGGREGPTADPWCTTPPGAAPQGRAFLRHLGPGALGHGGLVGLWEGSWATLHGSPALAELSNVEFHCGRAEELVPTLVSRLASQQLVAILDPPRAGLREWPPPQGLLGGRGLPGPFPWWVALGTPIEVLCLPRLQGGPGRAPSREPAEAAVCVLQPAGSHGQLCGVSVGSGWWLGASSPLQGPHHTPILTVFHPIQPLQGPVQPRQGHSLPASEGCGRGPVPSDPAL